MATEGGELTEEEFATWIPAHRAYHWLAQERDDYTGATTAIVKRVVDGLIRSAAQTLTRPADQQRWKRLWIPARWWGVVSHQHSGLPLWQTEGDAQFEEATRKHTSYERRIAYNAYGIRFEPVDILAPLAPKTAVASAALARVRPPYSATQRVTPTDRPKKVTKDELRQWFPEYERNTQDFRFETVNEAAAAHFGPRPVTRQPLRDVIGEFERTRNRGKPSTS